MTGGKIIPVIDAHVQALRDDLYAAMVASADGTLKEIRGATNPLQRKIDDLCSIALEQGNQIQQLRSEVNKLREGVSRP